MSPDSEEALQESEDGYRALFEESLDGIFMTRPDGTVLDANPVACAMLGMTKEEICAAGRTGLVESSPEIGELVQDRDRTGKAVGELTLIRGDGTRFLAEFSSVVLPDSTGPRRSFVIFRDITERKRVEEALRLTQFSVDGAADYVFWMSPSGRILYVNDSACKRLGYSRDELLNLSVWDITVSSTPEDRRARWQEIKRRGSLMFEREHLTKGGETFPVEIIANYFEYQGLELNCSFSRDITERKKAEQTLTERDEQLRQSQKMEAVGQLAGGIAHDFNNLLTAIIGYSDLILMGPESGDSTLREDVREIKKAAERASGLTRQILAFSRRQALQPQVISMNDLVAEMEPLLQRTLGEDIDLVITLDPELGATEVDPNQLMQVVMNLAVNARDAMPAGGGLTIATANVELTDEYCLTSVDAMPGWYVMLTVSDTGVGMDAATASHIFEPFFTTKATGEGTGLGLSTVYGIVKQSKGSISVHSEPGRGTAFKIYLPRVEESPHARSELHHEITLTGRQQGTILVVEDEESVRRLIQRVLLDQGYNILAAGTAAEALAIFESNEGPIDLLLTDVVLPGGMQGNDLAQVAVSLQADLPVLYISGYTRDAILESGRLIEGLEYLEKPFTPSQLASKVRDVLGAHPGAT